MKVIAVVQARMGSRRLPGKSLLPVKGEPLFVQMLRKTQQLDVSDTILATSSDESDDVLEYWAQAYSVPVIRGEVVEDVLDRYLMVAEVFDPDYIVRVCGDSPCIDVELTNALIDTVKRREYDYVGYQVGDKAAILSTHGVFAEVIRGQALKKATTFDLEYFREHVTNVFYKTDRFNIKLIPAPRELQEVEFKTSIDEPGDYFNVRSLIDALGHVPRTYKEILPLVHYVADGGGWQAYGWDR